MTTPRLAVLTGPRIRRQPALARVGGAVVVAGLAALLGACSGGSSGSTVTVTITPTVTVTPSPTPSTPPTSSTTTAVVPPQSYAEALQHVGTGTPDAAVTTAFLSPSGNIVCAVVAGGAVRGCELKTGRIPPPTPDFCASAGGGATDIGRVQFGPGGPVAVCNKAAVVTGSPPVLPYGSRATSGSVACVSESIGVTCLDSSTQHGFFLARDTFFIF